jgi:trimeric autotransporter adhesin
MKNNILPIKNWFLLKESFTFITMCFLLLAEDRTVQAQIELLKDANTEPSLFYYNEYQLPTDVNGILYFAESYQTLWKTDGTVEGTVRIKKFLRISAMVNISGTLYFVADDGITGPELWISTGSETGTYLVKDIYPGSLGSHPEQITNVNGIAYFVANDGATGKEIWKSDGTAEGTKRVKDIMRVSGSSNPAYLTSFKNKLYFAANDGVHGYELWVSDGSDAGTHIVKDILSGKKGSAPNFLTVSGELLYFRAKGLLDHELYKSDGTAEGTIMVKDIKPGTGGSFPSHLIDVDGTLFFRAADGLHGQELWKSDGTEEGTVMVQDRYKGGASGLAWLSHMVAANGKLYFYTGGANSAFAIHVSDGTDEGTKIIDSNGILYGGVRFSKLNNDLYFIKAVDYIDDTWLEELWRMDETGPVHIADIGVPADGQFLVTSDQQMFMISSYLANGARKTVLSRSDGTAAGTREVVDVFTPPANSNPSQLTDLNGALYFTTSSDADFGRYYLWKSNGTEGGTLQQRETTTPITLQKSGNTLYYSFYSGEYNSGQFIWSLELWRTNGLHHVLVKKIQTQPTGTTMIDVNGILFFIVNGNELWRSNGTAAGTVLVKKISEGSASCSCNMMVNANGTLYFAADDGITGRELWKSDGTTMGTQLVKDIYNGRGQSFIRSLVALGSTVYFVAYTNTTSGLWRSNGTDAGTTLVKEIRAANLKVYNNTIFFIGEGGVLWKSNGTTAGTLAVKDFHPGEDYISLLQTLGSDLYILAGDYALKNYALWKTNGTTEGTVKVVDHKVSSFPFYTNVTSDVMNNRLYYTTSDHQVWVTDGTACNTTALTYQSDPFAITHAHSMLAIGNTLFFAATTNETGTELFKIDEENVPKDECIALAQAEPEVRISYFPNPFTTSCDILYASSEESEFSLSIINSNGHVAEQLNNLKSNTNYTVGANLTKGIYLLKLSTNEKTYTSRIVKSQ